MSTVADGVDFVAAPWLYPGPAAPGTGLLTRDGYHRARARADFGASTLRLAGTTRTVDGALRAAGVDGVRDRRLVVAVGSNACPAVVARKLTGGHVDPTVPFLRATVTGMAVGHSAHVSVAGYVAATAFRRPGARTAVFASLLDRDQLACLDATEPNYTRRAVTADECILAIDGGSAAGGLRRVRLEVGHPRAARGGRRYRCRPRRRCSAHCCASAPASRHSWAADRTSIGP